MAEFISDLWLTDKLLENSQSYILKEYGKTISKTALDSVRLGFTENTPMEASMTTYTKLGSEIYLLYNIAKQFEQGRKYFKLIPILNNNQ
jgi:hypothetical protein